MLKDDILKIRTFNTKDTQAVVELWQTCGLIRAWNDPYKDIQRKLTIQPELFLVGEANTVIVASIMAGYEGHRGWINYLAIAPDHQRFGHARKLLQQVEKLLEKLNCPKINIQIREENLVAREFYQSCGFAIDHSISMGKRLITDH